MTTPLPVLPQIIVEAGLVTASPVQPGSVLVLDDASLGKLDAATLADADTWTDLSSRVISFTISRPATRQQGPLWQWQAATASVVMDNSDGALDPDNLNGPFVTAGVTELHAMVPVRVRANFGPAAYPLYRGFADGWMVAQVTYEGGYAEMTLPATDAFKVLAGITLPATAAVGGGETSGARISRVLTAAGWYTDGALRSVAAGNATVQSTTFGDTALSLMQAAATAEAGQLYADGAGRVVFRDKQAILTDARSASVQAFFGDLPAPGGPGNMLLGDDASFNGGTLGSWAANANCTLAVSTAQAHSGTWSMAITASSGGTVSAADGTNFIACQPGATVVVSAWFRAAATPRGWRIGVQFFDSGGSFISTVMSNLVTDSTSAWTLASTRITAPAGAGQLHAYVQADFAAAAEVHYADDLSVFFPEMPYAAMSRASDDTTIANDVQATIVNGGTLQEAKDVTSIARYLFPRSYANASLILTSDPAALAWAQWVLYISRTGEDRFESLTIDPQADPANLWPQVLGREIGDRIQVYQRPAGVPVTSPVVRDCFIAGITHTWDSVTSAWSTTWTLQDASKFTGSFLILDSASNGKLDTAVLGS